MSVLDKNSYIPYYVQIKHLLQGRIRNGEYLEGSRIPSEHVLSQEFSVTRMTVRKALDDLRREGMIATERGKGSVVARKKIEQSLTGLYRFGEEIGDTGIPASSKVISLEQSLPPAEVTEIFGDRGIREYYKLVRLRFLKQDPVSLEYSYIPCDTAPGFEREAIEQVSLITFLEETYHLKVGKAIEYLYPRISDEYESALLEIPNHSPVFMTERITRSDDDRVIEFRRSIIRGDIVKFSAVLA